jgi:hypothetical protein
MLSWGALPLAFAAAQPVDQPRLQTELPNGVRIYAREMPSAGRAAIQMTASLAEISDDPSLHGLPHMIEHLAGLGRDRRLDERLESQGMLLVLSTNRDALSARIECRPEQARFALTCLLEVASSLEIDEAELEKERQILLQEMALDNPLLAFDRAAWSTLEGGADPMGTPEAFAAADPLVLAELHSRIFRGRRLAITMASPLPAKVMADRAAEVFGSLAEGDSRTVPERLTTQPDRPLAVQAPGAARALAVEGLDSRSSLAAYGAALAFGMKEPGLAVIYPPSLWRGFITLVHSDPKALERLDRLSGPEAEWYAYQGREQLRRWTRRLEADPVQFVEMQGRFSIQSPSYGVDDLVREASLLDWRQVRDALPRFRPGRVIEVKGA